MSDFEGQLRECYFEPPRSRRSSAGEAFIGCWPPRGCRQSIGTQLPFEVIAPALLHLLIPVVDTLAAAGSLLIPLSITHPVTRHGGKAALLRKTLVRAGAFCGFDSIASILPTMAHSIAIFP